MSSASRAPLRALVVALVSALLVTSAVAAPAVAADTTWGYRVLSGAALDAFRVPPDVRLVRSWTERRSGLTFERYQQYAAPIGVLVDGAQLTVVRRGQEVVLVSGRHYPGLRALQRPTLAPVNAAAVAADRAGEVAGSRADRQVLATRSSQLRLDPEARRLFYLVESTAPGVRVFTAVDATSGAVLESWNGLDQVEPGKGTGVKGDRKSLRAGAPIATDLTSINSSGKWVMSSVGATPPRYQTFDARNGWSYGPSLALANDSRRSAWGNNNDWAAKAQRAAVDAQYYAAFTDGFYRDRFGFDLLDHSGLDSGRDFCNFDRLRSVVHFDVDYANAFWDGQYMVYGDGDGFWFGPMSGSQDVITHELTHAVTECTSNLEYHHQPGALNESFSDIMAIAAEFDYEEPLSSNCRLVGAQSSCADWLLAEDLIIGGPDPAIRNLADPPALGQPSHWSDRFYPSPSCNPTGSNDYCGVHDNSGIPNHAFYLLVEGGRNVRCSGPADSTPDCPVLVPGIGMEHAERIFFLAFTSLSTDATFCEARDATVATAQLLVENGEPGYTMADVAATDLAWRAVGVGRCSAPFSILPSARAIIVQPGPGATAQVSLVLQRHDGNTTPLSVSASDPAPAVATLSDPPTLVNSDDVLQLTLDATSAPSGIYPVVVTASDGAGGEALASVVMVVDGDAPTTQVDALRIVDGAIVNVGQMPLSVSWSSADPLSGLVSGGAERLVDEDPETWMQFSSAARGTLALALPEASHTFRSSATDAAGNTGTSAVFGRVLGSAQESAASYAGGWTLGTTPSPWGTQPRFSKKAGASATYIFSGTDIAWVAPRGPKRGRAAVYIDNVLRATVDLYSSSFRERRVVFNATGLADGPHTLRIVVKGTIGRPRVDVDGFITLAPIP